MRLSNTAVVASPALGGAFEDGVVAEAGVERSLWLANAISIVCLPPLLAIGTLVALSSHFIGNPAEAARVAIVSSFFIAVAPCVYIAYLLKRHKLNGGVDLVYKEERLRPYLVGVGSSLLGLLALSWLSAPRIVTVLALCYAVNTGIMALITPRWKISAHAAGAALPLTALLSAFGTAALPFAVIIPVVCWARVKAQMHTVAQVCAGTALGLLLTWLQLALLAPHLG